MLNAIDLFCGCGGFSKGIIDSGINIIAGIDIWDKAIDNYNRNFGEDHQGICADLCKLSPQQFNKLYNKDKKSIDIIINSPPCQSFSISGRRDVNDSRNDLFLEFVKYLDYFKPKAFLLENVIGLLSKKDSSGQLIIDKMLELLEKNYKCNVCKLYASDFEVPQNRRRVIIIGFRNDLNIIPESPKLVIKNPEERIPVSTILDPAEQVSDKLFLSQKAIEGIKKKKEKSKKEGKGFGAQFLKLDKPSYTIPARFWKDGYDALVYYSESKIRRLSIEELKRVQTFPDNYILEGTKKDIIIQIGNAVACKFAYHLGKYLISNLADK